MIHEPPGLFLEVRDQGTTEIEEWIVLLVADDGVAAGRELEIDEFPETILLFFRGDDGASIGEADLILEVGHG